MHSLIGKPIYQLETPALIIDLDIFERNIQKMSGSIIGTRGIGWRPHVKALKYPGLVKYLLKAGATGVTCSNVGQAEKMAAAGIRDILIANQVIAVSKIEAVIRLNGISTTRLLVDSKEGIDILDNVNQTGKAIEVLVEIDTGLKRSGTTPAGAIELIKYTQNKKGVRITGIMTWEAHALDEKDHTRKKDLVQKATSTLKAITDEAKAMGYSLEIVSAGGTGTYWVNGYAAGVTEVQAGGGAIGDLQYTTSYDVPSELSLSVLTQVISHPAPNRIICDAGRKYLSNHYPPSLNENARATLIGLSAEHCRIELNEPSPFKIGDKIKLYVGDSDLTMHLHHNLYGHRNEVITELFN
ncbi:MAG: alanine racemase [Chitinophagaceae bacterium]